VKRDFGTQCPNKKFPLTVRRHNVPFSTARLQLELQVGGRKIY
jgi:hypothetical protein